MFILHQNLVVIHIVFILREKQILMQMTLHSFASKYIKIYLQAFYRLIKPRSIHAARDMGLGVTHLAHCMK